ncbi:group III truncated hemoglobin [Hyphococcus luteus]|uniref:Globin n=1 Tax=Hyphococcus luteus TaxID=2058213 RepID=A0A2S7K2W3_9PROT|nr:group III truncated hemoglobin [Marinicaulis flavus]PQA86826.1 globin [Marinicaulis flavus]
METRIRTADERRREIEAAAVKMGIDEAYISVLVDTFYGKVRAHPVLGPVFAEKISDWGPHLAKMKDFWASVALNAGRYSGKPVPKHAALTSVQERHFDIWLGLFRETLDETAPTPQAADYFMERAMRIAESLKLAMFGLPGLRAPAQAET